MLILVLFKAPAGPFSCMYGSHHTAATVILNQAQFEVSKEGVTDN